MSLKLLLFLMSWPLYVILYSFLDVLHWMCFKSRTCDGVIELPTTLSTNAWNWNEQVKIPFVFSSEDLPHPRIEPGSPALQEDS